MGAFENNNFIIGFLTTEFNGPYQEQFYRFLRYSMREVLDIYIPRVKVGGEYTSLVKQELSKFSFDRDIKDSRSLSEFLRGCIQCHLNPEIIKIKDTIEIPINDIDSITGLVTDLFNISFDVVAGHMVFSGINYIEILNKIFNYPDEIDYTLNDVGYYTKFKKFIGNKSANIQLTCDQAVMPSKPFVSDVGYDITIIKKVKDLTSDTVLYDTGIKIEPPMGFYTEIHPRSSISKSGYILANGVGIIDPSYTGNILVALKKVTKDSDDLTLPFRCCQIIFREQPYVSLKLTTSLSSTKRGSGGFGSSGV
jgi:deoxyuridine 5'-triphosphate nucleotidohydrolase